MRKPIFYAFILTAILITSLSFVGFIQIIDLFNKHGLNYEIITIIAGEEKTETHSILVDLVGIFFLLWIDCLMILAAQNVKYAESIQSKQDQNGQEN